MADGFVNAYWRGDVLACVNRVVDRVLVADRRADHSFFVRSGAMSAALSRSLTSSRYCVGMAVEGDWTRLRWRYDRPYNERPVHEKIAKFVESAHKVQTYEADVSPVRRWIVEADVSPVRPRRCYLDIETDSRVPFSHKFEARVIAWSLIADDGFERVGVLAADDDASERSLLAALWRELDRFDQVIAWNGDRFDFPMVQRRSALLALAVEPRRWLWLDHLVLYRRMNISSAESGEEKQSMALNAVANAVLGEGKLAGVSGAKSWDEWAAGGTRRGRLLDYCARDADLMRRIEEKTGYVELLQTLCDATHTFADSYGANPSGQVEGFMMRLAQERGIKFPSHYGVEESERFAGAYVMEPTCKGMARNVHVADFAGMYPSIIMSWNMSTETHRPDIKLREDVSTRPAYLSHLPARDFPLPPAHCVAARTDAVFATEPQGILALAVEELGRLRSSWNKKKAELPPGTPEWKEADRRSTAYKIARNSFYGVIGAPFSRFFRRKIAESVSQCGVFLIGEVIAAAKAKEFDVVYADTDSIFVRGVERPEFERFVEWCNTDLFPRLLREKGCTRNDIKLDYEKAFERIVFVSAKRYVGRYSHYKGTAARADSKPEIKGLEYKRGDVVRLARELQAEVIALLVSGDDAPAATEFVAIIDRWCDLILNGELTVDDVRISKRLAKPLGEYVRKTKADGNFASEQPHVAVARALKQRGQDVGEGSKIEYVVLDGGAAPMVVQPAADWDGKCDRFYLWENLVWPPTERLLAAAYPGESWSKWSVVRPPRPPRVTKAAIARTMREKIIEVQPSLFGDLRHHSSVCEPKEQT